VQSIVSAEVVPDAAPTRLVLALRQELVLEAVGQLLTVAWPSSSVLRPAASSVAAWREDEGRVAQERSPLQALLILSRASTAQPDRDEGGARSGEPLRCPAATMPSSPDERRRQLPK
jgi:hypothetical protein